MHNVWIKVSLNVTTYTQAHIVCSSVFCISVVTELVGVVAEEITNL